MADNYAGHAAGLMQQQHKACTAKRYMMWSEYAVKSLQASIASLQLHATSRPAAANA
jgi:hypothetical protein